MQRITLGRSGLDVPVFCVGTAPLGQVPQGEGVQVLRRAYELGVTWWDTSDSYGTEPMVGEALKDLPRQQLTISTKTFAAEYHEAEQAVKAAQQQLGTDTIDIMFLHYVQDAEDFRRRQDALKAFRDLHRHGVISAIGLSSHRPEAIRLAADVEDISVVMAPWNMLGHLPDDTGTMREMEEAIRACYAAGKGVVLMKVLDDGNLHAEFDEAIHAAVCFKERHAIVIGVKSVLELETDIRLTLGQPVDASILRFLKTGHSDGRAAA